MGKAAALQLIREGHTVYGAAPDVENMKDLVKLGGHSVQLDITKDDDITKLVNKVVKEQGRIDVLYNNAGYGLYGAVEDVPLQKARHQFEVNIFGLANITQKVLPQMRKQKSGLILNTSSMGGKIYTPFGSWYHATKHALEGWSDCLRLEVKKFGIKVVILEPGLIATNFANALGSQMPKDVSNSAWKDDYKRMMEMDNDSYGGTKPEFIAKLVSRIVRSRRPRTRYLKGMMAKPLVFIRNTFGDRFYDFLIRRAMM